MANPRPVLCAAIAAFCGLQASANAAIIFSYADPTALVKEFVYTQPGGPAQNGSLSYNQSIIHNFVIDARQESPGALTTVPATLHFSNISVGPAAQIGQLFGAVSMGDFEFRTTELSPRVLLHGHFDLGVLSTFFGSGAQQAAQNEIGGSLQFTAGPALFDVLAGVGYTLPAGGFDTSAPASAAWSLVNIEDSITSQSLVNFPPSGDSFFPNFSADNSFVARATVVPTPGAISMFGVVSAFLLKRRRRDERIPGPIPAEETARLQGAFLTDMTATRRPWETGFFVLPIVSRSAHAALAS